MSGPITILMMTGIINISIGNWLVDKVQTMGPAHKYGIKIIIIFPCQVFELVEYGSTMDNYWMHCFMYHLNTKSCLNRSNTEKCGASSHYFGKVP